MTGPVNPAARRRELGVLLRALRNGRGWTVDHVAEQLMCSPSKVSRMETGHRGASPRDVRDLCELYGVDGEQRDHLMQLARQGKQRSLWQSLNLPYSTYVALEAEATTISDYGLNLVPGLLQTADYARVVVRAAVPRWVPEVVEQRVSGRLTRQQILTSPADRPQFNALVDESVLHRVVGSPGVMAGQLTRLLEMTELPNVSLRVIPYRAGALPTGNKFIILNFAQETMPDVVFLEGLTGDLYLDHVDDVEAYNATFWSLGELAVSAAESREMISSAAAAYSATG